MFEQWTRVWKYCITPFDERFMFKCPHWCSVIVFFLKHLVHPSHVQTKPWCSHGRYVCVRKICILAKAAPQPSCSHLNGLIPRCTESICLFRSVELGNILSHPMCIRMDVSPSWPSLHDASYYSWTETSFRILPQCIQIALVISMLCVYVRRHPEFRTSSRIQDVYIDTVSTSSAPCRRVWVRLHAKHRRIARNHKVAISHEPRQHDLSDVPTPERFDAVVVRTDPRSDVKVHTFIVCHDNLPRWTFWTYSPGTCNSGSYQWESPIYELGVVDNFVLTKLIFGISTIYT
jgi:hypothetical protein